MKTFQKDKLTVEIYENRTLMGEAAVKDYKDNAYLLWLLGVVPKTFLYIR